MVNLNIFTTLLMPSKPDPDRSDLHGVIEVPHHPGRLPGCGVAEAGVVGVANNTLHPRQDPCRRHGLVREVTWNQNN